MLLIGQEAVAASSANDMVGFMQSSTLEDYCVEAVKVLDHDQSGNSAKGNTCVSWVVGFREGFATGGNQAALAENLMVAADTNGKYDQVEVTAGYKLAFRTEFGCAPTMSNEVFVRTFVKGMKDNPILFDKPAFQAISSIWQKEFPCPK